MITMEKKTPKCEREGYKRGLNIKKCISKVLSSVERSGNFSVGGIANEMPVNPGISMKNMEDHMIPLPITEHYAEKIKSIAHVAPFGKGMNTIVDEKVRKAWELDADMIQFSHPNWENSIKNLVQRISGELGCGGTVKAKLYKVLLYEEGGHFLPHKDTEKILNMFGTLIVQLPSICEGGSLICCHKGIERRFDFGQSTGMSPFETHYAAHYADVEHQLTPIEKGHRLALTYSLYWTGNPAGCPSATGMSESVIELANHFKQWNELAASNKCLGVLLEHEYTTSGIESLGFNVLKGQDKTILGLIQQANATLIDSSNMRLHIVQLSRTETWAGNQGYGYGYDWDDLIESDNKISCWYDEKGNKFPLGRCMGLELGDILNIDQDDDLDDEEWWGEVVSEDIEGYTGNAGPTKSTTYHRYALVIYPAKAEFSILLESCGAMGGAVSIQREFGSLEWKASSQHLPDLCAKFNRTLGKWDGSNSRRWYDYRSDSNSKVGSILTEVVVKLKRRDLLLNLLQKLNSFLEDSTFYQNIDFVPLVCAFQWSNVADQLRPIILKMDNDLVFFTTLLKKEQILPQDEIIQNVWRKNKEKLGKISHERAMQLWSFIATVKNEDYSEDFINLVLTKTTEKVCGEIVKSLLALAPIDQSPPALKTVVQGRLEKVRSKLENGKPRFSWCMPNAIVPHHPAVQTFFRGPEKDMMYRNFNNIKHARCWINKHISGYGYNLETKKYSATASAHGAGSNAYAMISKTKVYFESCLSEYRHLEKEAAMLQKKLGIVEEAGLDGSSKSNEEDNDYDTESEVVVLSRSESELNIEVVDLLSDSEATDGNVYTDPSDDILDNGTRILQEIQNRQIVGMDNKKRDCNTKDEKITCTKKAKSNDHISLSEKQGEDFELEVAANMSDTSDEFAIATISKV